MNHIELQKAIEKVFRDRGYKMNRAWMARTSHHCFDNFKIGGQPRPVIWLDNQMLSKVTDKKILEDALEELREEL